ncbi:MULTISPECIES: PqiB family protein [Pseudomonas]|uniref:MCE family protein n=2 Tax=Pseudomonas TaxID=286 RepID=A0AAD0L6R9_PSEPU|nr:MULTISPECIES: MlaD family protein [Pseudomonas]ANC01718.1 mammalian cell entry protein [Pseudomonas putida]AXA23319.1 MCE family protein [Pseudomonas putida]MBK0057611.1 MCE family protein [Pseudomonas sp. S44]MEA5671620.1 MlaD family protein [Pseudomonas sp. MH2]OCT24415.1 mammalian cell entry protein [Pseudomonas putida]
MSDLPTAKTRPASNWSAIWILPLIALMIGGWLAWQAYRDAGVEIQVRFETGEGIVANKTEVIYKGMSVGKVTSLVLDAEGSNTGVIATIEMNKTAEPHMNKGTRFWLVKPSVSLAGISGLETLVSGNYIAVDPGQGEPTRRFTALAEAPPLSDKEPGLHLTLKAERLGSLNRESPVFYKQIQVGKVKSYRLSDDHGTVEIKLFIEPEYAGLVRKHTRFWNASGISIDANLSGVKVRSESLSSIVAGGIAFATPEHRKDSPPTDPSLPFRLYEDFEAAQAGIRIKVHLTDYEGLQAGRTPVMYKGIQVGSMKTLKIDDGLDGAMAELTLDPLAEDYLVEGTQFWVVKPSISLAGITGLEALVKGNYIAIRPGEKGARPQREFEARAKAPPLDLKAPGLHLVLFADTLGSLEVGSPVTYRQVKVGSVQSYQFARNSKRILIGVHIEKEYAGLVNGSTRFWNASGITLTGGLSGIKIKSESLQTLMAGGIAFDTPQQNVPLKRHIPRFRLLENEEAANRAGTLVTIRVERADGLKPGTPIRFRGLDVGSIESVDLTSDLQAVLLRARITDAADRIARAGTQFWVVKPAFGLVRTENLDTLIGGQYLEVQPALKSQGPQRDFIALPEAPEVVGQEVGLPLTLSASRRGSIKPGVPVTYREVQVGKVTGYELGQSADRVLIHILIEPRYAALVRGGSRFWNSSGFGFDWGLFKGATVRTESLETLIDGGIAFATPDGEQMGNPARPQQTFALFDKPDDAWLQWAPKIPVGK